ncbi:recombinase family protein [Alkalimonas sp. MEB108]|uniref:Recombinase family protein n=1 Tax=Alkalimonas cellulosilytica TaxID=3058395 RepID=A0ABU7J558_9GAMM|nr:recombinase family protein [Alkalimonas sp. MEB108]MEE2001651.1 recombinase family protein [Alkalimonas sp. MEB108]
MTNPVAISYGRFSSIAQGEGRSVERQELAAKKYCEVHGLELTDRYFDEGLSGFHGVNRSKGDLSILLERVQSGAIPQGTYLLIEETSRLTRENALEAISLIQSLVSAGLVIVTLDDGLRYSRENLTTDFHNLLALILRLQRGHDESKVKSMRAKDVWLAKRQQASEGKAPSMRRPFWLDKEGRLNERAEVVREVFRLQTEELKGSQAIARELNARGIPSANGRSKWRAEGISHLLRNEAVIGVFHDLTNDRRLSIYEPAISLSQFNEAQQILTGRRTSRGSTGEWLSALNGIVKCGTCGGYIRWIKTKTGRTGYCRAARADGCSNRKGFSYRASLLFTYVRALDAVLHLKAQSPDEKDQRAELERKLKEADAKIQRWIKLVDELGDDQFDEVAERLKAAKAERTAIEKALLKTNQEDGVFERMMDFLLGDGPDLMDQVIEGDPRASEKLNALFRQIGINPVIQDGSILDGDIRAEVLSWQEIALKSPDKTIGKIFKDPTGEYPIQLGGGYGYNGDL